MFVSYWWTRDRFYLSSIKIAISFFLLSLFELLFNDQARKMISTFLMIRLLFNDQACFVKVRGEGGRGESSTTTEFNENAVLFIVLMWNWMYERSGVLWY